VKIITCAQGTPEWLAVRLGKITGSRADEIITNKTAKPSASMAKYAYDILAEEIAGRPLDDQSSSFMERGKEMEDEARAWYEFDQDVEVERVGFVVRDDGKAGCSPDGLIGDDGVLEIKCPEASNHLAFLLGNPADNKYYQQMMFVLWVTERQWVDFVSYCPGLPAALVRFKRDEKFIAALSACVDAMLALLDQHRETLRTMGALPPLEELSEAA
jgi:putative phage-type endonuclease